MKQHWATKKWPGIAFAVLIAAIAIRHWPVTDDAATQATFRTGSLLVDGAATIGGDTALKKTLSICASGIVGCGASESSFITVTDGTNDHAIFTSNGTYSTGFDVRMEGAGIVPTVTQERIAFDGQIVGSISTINGAVGSYGVQAQSSATKSAGAGVLTNVGGQFSAGGGDVNLGLWVSAGTTRLDGPTSGAASTWSDVSSGTIEASGLIHATGAGADIQVDGNAIFGTNSSQTFAMNSTITNPVLLMSNATDNTILRLAQTGAGGNTWSFGSGDTAAATGAGLSIVNNTFGWETLHIKQATAGHPGVLEFAGGHTGEGSTFNGSMVPTISACGTGSPQVIGTDRAGRITEATGAAGCTIAFVNAYTTPSCVCSSRTQLAAFTCTPSTTQLVLTNTVTTGDVIDYVCTELSP